MKIDMARRKKAGINWILGERERKVKKILGSERTKLVNTGRNYAGKYMKNIRGDTRRQESKIAEWGPARR